MKRSSHKPLRKAAFVVVFVGLLLVVTLVLAELAAFVFLFRVNGDWDSKRRLQSTLYQATESSGIEAKGFDQFVAHVQPHILHPFLGFVRNPELKEHEFNGRIVREPLNDYGFWGPNPLAANPDDEYVIAILGGSVATEFYLTGREFLTAQLRSKGLLEERDVRFVSIALGGMKQPQQLLALSYFLALGASFDAVINLDGFNEMVLSLAENSASGVNPFYPRNWRLYATKSLSPTAVVLSGEIAVIKKRLAYWSRLTGRFPIRESHVALALWQQYHRRMTARQQALEDEIRAHYPIDSEITAQESGPPYSPTTGTVVYSDLAGVWRNSSEQLYALCKANGIDYYHFLHPNQYYKGTRTLTEWERENVVVGMSPYQEHAEAGFEHFRIAGQLLKASGAPISIFPWPSLTNHEPSTGIPAATTTNAEPRSWPRGSRSCSYDRCTWTNRS
jgi:hypothetical protein